MMSTLVETLVPDELWAIVAPLLPPAPRPWYGGRTRTVLDRNCFAAIVYMARTSTPCGCCQLVSLAAARRRRYVAAWSNGATLACLNGCTTSCWIGWAPKAWWTGRGRALTP